MNLEKQKLEVMRKNLGSDISESSSKRYYEYADSIREEIEKYLLKNVKVDTYPDISKDIIIVTFWDYGTPIFNGFIKSASSKILGNYLAAYAADDIVDRFKKSLLKRYLKEVRDGDQV